jgi:hypothetical protein
MLAASCMGLDMMLVSHGSGLLSLGLRLLFADGGRLRNLQLLPTRQVAPESQSS